MATDIDEDETENQEPSDDAGASDALAKRQREEETLDDGVPAQQLGVQRYVHAAFFACGVLFAFLAGKVLTSIWNTLADKSWATRAVPQLLRYPEEQRESFGLAGGAVLGAIVVIQVFRRPTVRRWADEVAQELSKVTWPNREMVVNGTLVVVLTSAIATTYVAVLDRFWGFLTNLVYGA